MQLLATDEVDAGFIAHPSFVTKEEIEAVRKPIFIAAAGMFGIPSLSSGGLGRLPD